MISPEKHSPLGQKKEEFVEGVKTDLATIEKALHALKERFDPMGWVYLTLITRAMRNLLADLENINKSLYSEKTLKSFNAQRKLSLFAAGFLTGFPKAARDLIKLSWERPGGSSTSTKPLGSYN